MKTDELDKTSDSIEVITVSNLLDSIKGESNLKNIFNKRVIEERDGCLSRMDLNFSITLNKEIFGYTKEEISFITEAGYLVESKSDCQWLVTLP